MCIDYYQDQFFAVPVLEYEIFNNDDDIKDDDSGNGGLMSRLDAENAFNANNIRSDSDRGSSPDGPIIPVEPPFVPDLPDPLFDVNNFGGELVDGEGM